MSSPEKLRRQIAELTSENEKLIAEVAAVKDTTVSLFRTDESASLSAGNLPPTWIERISSVVEAQSMKYGTKMKHCARRSRDRERMKSSVNCRGVTDRESRREISWKRRKKVCETALEERGIHKRFDFP
jgi:hypothetical protein